MYYDDLLLITGLMTYESNHRLCYWTTSYIQREEEREEEEKGRRGRRGQDTTTPHHNVKEMRMEILVPIFFAIHAKKKAPTIPAKFVIKAKTKTKMVSTRKRERERLKNEEAGKRREDNSYWLK